MSKNSEWRGSCHVCGAGIMGDAGTCDDCRETLKRREHIKNSPFHRYAKHEFSDGLSGVVCANALEQAYEQGRLDPHIATEMGIEVSTWTCDTCGMAHRTGQEAQACCADMMTSDEIQRLLWERQMRRWETRRAKAAKKRMADAASREITEGRR